MTIVIEEDIFAVLRTSNTKYEISKNRTNLSLRFKTERYNAKQTTLKFEPIKSRGSQNFLGYSPIFFINRSGLEIMGNFQPFIISASEDILVNGEILTKGSKRILQHRDEIKCVKMQEIAIFFEDQRTLLGSRFPEKILQEFYPFKKFADGSTEAVYGVQVIRDPNKKFVLKKITKKKGEKIAQEAKIMLELNHPNIVSLLKVYDCPCETFVLMEYLELDLLSYITQSPHGCLSEQTSKLCFYQIAQGLKYMHNLNIGHQDIKPENIFVKFLNGNPVCKLGDFGLSSYDKGQHEACGTLLYCSPENLATNNGNYSSKKADMWSLGVVLFAMITGKWPFHGKSSSDIRNAIKKGEVSFTHFSWKNASFELLNMVNVLLQIIPSLRFTIKEVLQHSWLDDHQLKKTILELKKSIQFNQQELQNENKIHIIDKREETTPYTDSSGRKRKLPFSVPPEMAQKRARS